MYCIDPKFGHPHIKCFVSHHPLSPVDGSVGWGWPLLIVNEGPPNGQGAEGHLGCHWGPGTGRRLPKAAPMSAFVSFFFSVTSESEVLSYDMTD